MLQLLAGFSHAQHAHLGLLLFYRRSEGQQLRRHRLPRLAQHVDQLTCPRLVRLPAEESVRDPCERVQARMSDWQSGSTVARLPRR